MVSNPSYSVISDFDEDGKPDVALLSFSGMAILRNTSIPGTISFAPKIDLFPNISKESQIAVTDVDGDGKPDIEIIGYSDFVYVIRNTSRPGHISFALPVSIPTGFSPSSVALGDLNNDGKPDLVVLNAGNNSISFYKNLCTAGMISFDNRTSLQLHVVPDNLALDDFDGDGKLDVAFVTRGEKFVYILRNLSTVNAISFADKIAYDAPYTPGHMFAGDMNLDGKADIVVNNASNGNNFSVFVNKSLDDGLPAVLVRTMGSTDFCEGGHVILNAPYVNGASYQWYKNGMALVSETDSVYTATTAGIYSVRVLSGGMVSTSAPVAVSVTPNPLPPALSVWGQQICVRECPPSCILLLRLESNGTRTMY